MNWMAWLMQCHPKYIFYKPIKVIYMKLFEAKNVGKRFEGVIALKSANFKIEGSKICGLVGANGSGKTTFARICAGLVKADDGQIFIDGRKVEINSSFDAKKLGIVLVHQNLSLIPDLSVWENINLGHEKRSNIIFFDNKYAKQQAQEVLNDLSPDEISINNKVSSLSPGQMQIVEIAKALSQNPKLLILDEPTAALEYFQVERLFKKVKELKEKNISVIFISHRLWEITTLCDVVYVFRNGETVGEVDFSSQPRDEKLIVPLVIGANGSIDYIKKDKRELGESKTVLKLENVTFLNKISNINLTVKRGEVLGLGGLNGQGQEELLMLLSGVLRPTGGKMFLEDREIKLKHPVGAIRNGIFMVPGDRQKDGLFMSQTIFNNVIYPRFSQKKERFILDFKTLYEKTDEIISKVSLVPALKELIIGNLSGGNQQKIVFGRWLQFSSKVLLLNDPAKGIDIQTKNDLYKLVRGLAHEGTSVVLYASSNEELINNCDRVLIMFEGKFVEEICHEEICDEKLIKSSLRVG